MTVVIGGLRNALVRTWLTAEQLDLQKGLVPFQQSVQQRSISEYQGHYVPSSFDELLLCKADRTRVRSKPVLYVGDLIVLRACPAADSGIWYQILVFRWKSARASGKYQSIQNCNNSLLYSLMRGTNPSKACVRSCCGSFRSDPELPWSSVLCWARVSIAQILKVHLSTNK